MNKNKKVVLRVSYNASKLARRLPKITSKLFSDIAEKTVDFLEKNTKKGLDINGNKFEPLSDATIKMRKKGFGSYETPISHSRPLIASKKMVSIDYEDNMEFLLKEREELKKAYKNISLRLMANICSNLRKLFDFI